MSFMKQATMQRRPSSLEQVESVVYVGIIGALFVVATNCYSDSWLDPTQLCTLKSSRSNIALFYTDKEQKHFRTTMPDRVKSLLPHLPSQVDREK